MKTEPHLYTPWITFMALRWPLQVSYDWKFNFGHFEKWVLGSVGAVFLKVLIVTAKGTCLHKYTLIAWRSVEGSELQVVCRKVMIQNDNEKLLLSHCCTAVCTVITFTAEVKTCVISANSITLAHWLADVNEALLVARHSFWEACSLTYTVQYFSVTVSGKLRSHSCCASQWSDDTEWTLHDCCHTCHTVDLLQWQWGTICFCCWVLLYLTSHRYDFGLTVKCIVCPIMWVLLAYIARSEVYSCPLQSAASFDATCLSWVVLRLRNICLSACLSVTLVHQDHIGWKSCKIIAQTVGATHLLYVAQRPSTYSQGYMQKFGGRLEVGWEKVACIRNVVPLRYMIDWLIDLWNA